MKKQAQRFREIRDKLGMSRNELAPIVGVSPQTIENIEGGEKMNSLPIALQRLGINPDYIHTGKGSVWLSGSDEENVQRIKALKSPGQQPVDTVAVQELRTELSRYREREDRLQRIIDKLLNGGANFLPALDQEASYPSMTA